MPASPRPLGRRAAAGLGLGLLLAGRGTSAQQAAWLSSGGGACAVQIDTGMNRLGFRPEDAPEPFPGLEMVLSHLACADDPYDAMNAAQRNAFIVGGCL